MIAAIYYARKRAASTIRARRGGAAGSERGRGDIPPRAPPTAGSA
jgi:hypothetical protein